MNPSQALGELNLIWFSKMAHLYLGDEGNHPFMGMNG